MIIATGSRLAPGFVLVDQQLLQVLGNIPSVRVEIYTENLDLVRFPSDRYGQIFSQYLTAKYAAHALDLIILAYVGNLAVPGKLLPELFPATPIIVAGLTEEEFRADQFAPLVSGVAQRIDVRATLDLILRVQPEVRRVIVIGGTAEIDRQVLQRVKAAALPFKGRVEIDYWDSLSMAQLRQRVTTLPAQTAVLVARLFRDAAGEPFTSSEVGRWIAQSASAPVYVMSDASIGTGAVGGSVASIESFAKRAGELARLVLSGSDIKTLPFEVRADSVPTFDWRALQRWGIPENRLPPNSVLRFKPQSLWQDYQWYLISGLIIIGLQAAMIAGLVLQRARRRRVEAELTESQQLMELAASAGELGLWSRDLIDGSVWINPAMRSLFGFGAQEAIRFDDLFARIHPDDRARVVAGVERNQAARLAFAEEFRVVLPSGRERCMLAKGAV